PVARISYGPPDRDRDLLPDPAASPALLRLAGSSAGRLPQRRIGRAGVPGTADVSRTDRRAAAVRRQLDPSVPGCPWPRPPGRQGGLSFSRGALPANAKQSVPNAPAERDNIARGASLRLYYAAPRWRLRGWCNRVSGYLTWSSM